MILSIALPLPSGAIFNTVRSVQQLQCHMTSGNILSEGNYNIGLQYLGTVTSQELLYVYSILDSINMPPLTVAYSSIVGGRGNVMAKIKPNASLTQLHIMLADKLEEQGFAVERRAYRPHVPMATAVKCHLPFAEVSKCIDVYNRPFVCDRVVLYEITYNDTVPTYTELYSVPLV